MSYGIENKPHLGGWWIGGDPNAIDPAFWKSLIDDYALKSIIDVGCGEGHAMQFFHDYGMLVEGVDGGENALNNNPLKDLTVLHDYCDGGYKPDFIYDACWCCEFVEHVEEKYIPNFIETFIQCKLIFMTHAVPGQEGYHHVNCQNDQYWQTIMEANGFEYDQTSSLQLRQKASAEHIKKSLMVFINNRYSRTGIFI